MKKISIMLIVILIVTIACTSCGGKHPIEEFKEHIDNADNYQVTITFGKITSNRQIDGNLTYFTSIMGEEYTEEKDGIIYSYTKNYAGAWKKTVKNKENTDNTSNSIMDDDDIFNPDNYEKTKDSKNSYKQKEGVVFENFSDVIIIIGKDNYTMEMKTTSNFVTVELKVVFSKFGEIELILPLVD